MSLFVDKNNRRKSPIAIAAFFTAVGYLCVYLVLYALLAEPLYRFVSLPGTAATNAAHTLIVAVIGTALCCPAVPAAGQAGGGLWLPRDWRWRWRCSTSRLCCWMQISGATMLQVISLYGLAPVLLGNAVAWPLYLRLRKTHPLPQQKTLREEIREAAEKSGGKVVRKAPQEEPAGAARRSSPEEDAMLLYGDDGENAG